MINLICDPVLIIVLIFQIKEARETKSTGFYKNIVRLIFFLGYYY
jgi:hypothetical protein